MAEVRAVALIVVLIVSGVSVTRAAPCPRAAAPAMSCCAGKVRPPARLATIEGKCCCAVGVPDGEPRVPAELAAAVRPGATDHAVQPAPPVVLPRVSLAAPGVRAPPRPVAMPPPTLLAARTALLC